MTTSSLLKVRPVDPLNHAVPIVDEQGRPTSAFQRQWIQARNVNLTTGDISVSVDELKALIEQAQALLDELTGRQIIAGTGLTGGGDLSADRTIAVSTPYTPASRQITAGTGLTGGGNLTADRTIALANTAVTPGTYGGVGQDISITVDAQGRVTAIANA